MSWRGYLLSALAVVVAAWGWVLILEAVRRELDAARLRRDRD